MEKRKAFVCVGNRSRISQSFTLLATVLTEQSRVTVLGLGGGETEKCRLSVQQTEILTEGKGEKVGGNPFNL